MLNYWWVTRPKRRLDSVPEVLSIVAERIMNQEWGRNRDLHLVFEDTLEYDNLKRGGDRRDHTGGGGRTYMAWLISLGLVFRQTATSKIMLTLAGEAILNGANPVKVLTGQILKYQFPSAFSISRGVNVSPEFRIRPFRFLLRLLADSRIQYLTQEEVAKIVITEAKDESENTFESVVQRILSFRESGDTILSADYYSLYAPSKATLRKGNPYGHLIDIANTFLNWIEYTQLVRRQDGKLRILPGREADVLAILADKSHLIDRPDDHEFFQRKFGIDPDHHKDTRDLKHSFNVTSLMIGERKVQRAFLSMAAKQPISSISPTIITTISQETGVLNNVVEDILQRTYPHGAIGSFLSGFFEMAFNGKEDATDFEKATVALFQDVFGFKTQHVGPKGLTPDVLLSSDIAQYQAIIDNKAYAKYSISNDHRNRMIYNYIGGLSNYSDSHFPLAFFAYIAGGFSTGIDEQIKSIYTETAVPGGAIPVSILIRLVEEHQTSPFTHQQLCRLFSLNRRLLINDLRQ